MEKHSILTKGCVLFCLIVLSFCTTPTNALPTHLFRRGDAVWGDTDLTAPILDLGGFPAWVEGLFNGLGVGTAGFEASQLGSNNVMTISPESGREEQSLPGTEASNPAVGRKVPATQPPEDASFYGSPKPVAGSTSETKLPAGNEQPDLGTIWVPKSNIRGQ